jgi:hypothetical protein
MTIAGIAMHHLEQQTSPVQRGSYRDILAEFVPARPRHVTQWGYRSLVQVFMDTTGGNVTAVLGLVLLGASISSVCLVLVRRNAVEEVYAPVAGRHRADISEAPLDRVDRVTVGAHMKAPAEA